MGIWGQAAAKRGLGPDFTHTNRLGGGIFGGAPAAAKAWAAAFYGTLERYFRAGRFAGEAPPLIPSPHPPAHPLAY